jgi:site-specific recombinase XerD
MITAIKSLFYLRKTKVNKRGTVPIFFRVTIDGKRFEVPTSRLVKPDEWSQETGRVISKSDQKGMTEINNYLDMLKARVFNVEGRLLTQEIPITMENFCRLWFGQAGPSKKLLDIFTEHNEQVRQLVGKTYSFGTWKRYNTSLRHTRAFLKQRYDMDDIDVNRIQYKFITDYDFWLRSTRMCGHNSAIKYLANFRKIIYLSFKNGWIVKDPFAGFKMTKHEVERPFLTKEEVHLIESIEIESDRLRNVRDVFLFCCYTGLAYADVEALSPNNLFTGVDGEQWISTRRRKTDVSARIPLLRTAKAILHSYRDDPDCLARERLLPVPSNQKLNAYLKDLALVCGIRKELTSHMARHTFATTVTLTNGVPIESVSKMLGHRSIRTTQLYAKVLDVKVSEDMNNLKRKLGEG